MKEKKKPYW